MVFGVRLINDDIYIYPWLTPVDPRCHGNEIWDKIGYNSACVRDFYAYRGFSKMCHPMLPIAFSRPTPVAMATKFGTKLVITQLVIILGP